MKCFSPPRRHPLLRAPIKLHSPFNFLRKATRPSRPAKKTPFSKERPRDSLTAPAERKRKKNVQSRYQTRRAGTLIDTSRRGTSVPVISNAQCRAPTMFTDFPVAEISVDVVIPRRQRYCAKLKRFSRARRVPRIFTLGEWIEPGTRKRMTDVGQ